MIKKMKTAMSLLREYPGGLKIISSLLFFVFLRFFNSIFIIYLFIQLVHYSSNNSLG